MALYGIIERKQSSPFVEPPFAKSCRHAAGPSASKQARYSAYMQQAGTLRYIKSPTTITTTTVYYIALLLNQVSVILKTVLAPFHP